MDPKSTAHLDPKLKEAYDRVMGTALNTAPASSNKPPVQTFSNGNQAPAASPFSPHDTVPGMGYQQPPRVRPTFEQASPIRTTAPAPQAPPVGVASSVDMQFVAPDTKAKSKGMSFIIALGMLVFFAVYSLFWIKLLGVHVAFLGS